MEVKASDAKALIARCVRAKLVPMLQGSPGAGKSSLVHEIAEEYNLQVIDVRLAQCDPTDLLGFPHIDAERQKAKYIPMATFPVEGDALPAGKDGWLLFLDEFNSADLGVQKAAYKLVLDRAVGEHKLHENVAIIAAGNKDTDNAIVERMSTALQSRLIHMELTVDPKEWIDWATAHDIDYRITSYISFKNEALYQFDPEHEDKTYACPRTWEFASRLIKGQSKMSFDDMALMAGTIGEGAAREFLGFTKVFNKLLTIPEIVRSPGGVTVPDEPSILFALTGTISSHADKNNIDPLMQFVERMPVEFQVVCLRAIVRRDKTLGKAQSVQKWITKNAAELY